MTEFDYPPGATPLDPDEAEGPIPDHIITRSELDRWEHENILRALDWIDRSKQHEILTEQFVRLLHLKMFGDVWKWAGRYRTTDKNIGEEFFIIPTSVQNLCDDVPVWIETKIYSPLEIGVRFHHRLVSIHPFPNGNGRHARLMTDLLVEHKLNSERFSWGGEDLSKRGEVRRAYISALQAADSHELGPLMAFVVS